MRVMDQIETRLTRAFAPEVLEVINESHLHAGHAGDDGTGESHFRIRIRAPQLAAMGRVDRHRAVTRALGDIMPRIHALALDAG